MGRSGYARRPPPPEARSGLAVNGQHVVLEERAPAGVSPQAILNAVRDPISVLQQPGGTWLFEGKNASVVLNTAGRLVTAWATNQGGYRG
jgi:hypothetical protein